MIRRLFWSKGKWVSILFLNMLPMALKLLPKNLRALAEENLKNIGRMISPSNANRLEF